MKNLATLSVLALLLTGCSSTPDPASFFLSAAATINPDPAGRPAPIEVWVYELKSPEAFERAGFFDLYQHPDNTLDNTVLGVVRLNLNPSQTLRIDRPLSTQTHYLGVLAGFRDLDHSHWRQVIAIDPDSQPVIHFDIDTRKIQVSEGTPPPQEVLHP
jgi:type VI secretion system protein VasD